MCDFLLGTDRQRFLWYNSISTKAACLAAGIGGNHE
jgi:hypothetical protein